MTTSIPGFTSAMFNDIKESLKKGTGTGSFRDMVRFKTGSTYLVRLLPYLKDLNKTFVHQYNHSFTGKSTGQFVDVVCPQTYGEPCPICLYAGKLWNKVKTPEAIETAREIGRKERWMVNCYVITDPTTPANEGTVKILKYGKQLDKKIKDAIEGEDAEEFGPKIFDLGANGCTFRIKVEKNEGGFPSYTDSKFLSSKAIDNLNPERAKLIYSQVFELDKLFSTKTYNELKEILETEILETKDALSVAKESVAKAKTEKPAAHAEEVDDDIPYEFPPKGKKSEEANETEEDGPEEVFPSDEAPPVEEKEEKEEKVATPAAPPQTDQNIEDELNKLLAEINTKK